MSFTRRVAMMRSESVLALEYQSLAGFGHEEAIFLARLFAWINA